ncbi:arabinogalactan endo-1,4-beta-galactosidase [Trebonia kvetii]|uniref:Arabinogalactan endo-beta-1,4-galactanase n=1 Tax=Trebonia kvetii TaxID=2480626 RepID=A0A6P2C0M1_9ACTN|nr:glycosyl hydrolase 53 family protein [Trebonia kvetii]TVZ02993.1 arabinogalactan endo-1,4-beta-galactosidase [Trebonia kvetii]
MKPRTPLPGPADGGSSPRRARQALVAAAAATALLITPAVTASATAAATSQAGGGAVTVVNPGFDADGTGTATPAGWSTYSPDGTASASYTEWTAEGYNGDSYQLTHWSTAAYHVDTYQKLTGIPNGFYTLGVWTRSSGGHKSDYIALTGCGGDNTPTAVPADSDGNWVQIVTSVHVTARRCTINLVTAGNAGDWTNFTGVTFTSGTASLPIRGGDVSTLYRGEQDGGVYYTASGRPENALAQLADAGMNWVRLRVWVNPADGMNDEVQLLASAREAKRHHQHLLLDFHYSDTWADPGHQSPPAAWASDTFPQLEADMYAYSKQVVAALVAQGTPPQMVQVGNEINNGLLWPSGSTSDFAQLAGLLKAGIAGVHAAFPPAKIVLHLAAAWDESGLAWWYSQAESYGVPFDIIGLSYYDYWHGRLDVLQGDLDGLTAQFGKPAMVVETAYPFTLASNDPTASLSFSDPASLDPGYPATPAGQAANFRDVLSVVQAVPNGMGLGAFYWEPTWTVVKGNGWDPTDPSSGDGWENQAMWDYTDTALPVISDFAAR